MPKVYGELSVARPVAEVYAYLRDRYETDLFRSVNMQTKNYVPDVRCVEEKQNERLSFTVAGRDSLFPINVGGWTWTYQLTSLDSESTRVAITYEWSIWMSLLSSFTYRLQAANELVETSLALEALAAQGELTATR